MDWDGVLDHARKAAQPFVGDGKVADYIPALAEADPNVFAMAIFHIEGDSAAVGDHKTPFSIQSISKVFTLTIALGFEGSDLWSRVGREPSGTAFNSIVQLERENGVPRNPFINAGALIVTDTILANCAPRKPDEVILDLVRKASAATEVDISERVAASEAKWGARNRSLAYFMKSFGNLKNEPEDVLDIYFRQCALEMTVSDLARAGLYLANGGEDPVTGERFISREQCNRINALMLTCGHYDASGDFAFRVGLPAKSGVGGGILAIAPGVGSVAVWSPALTKAGNSCAGSAALEAFADCTGLNVFSSKSPSASKFDD